MPSAKGKVRHQVLVIDDQSSVRDSICAVLDAYGIDAIQCASGEEGLEKLKTEAADAIISDFKMPGMDGLQLLKSLRSEGIETPFILVTGYGSLEMTMEALQLGTVEYLTKPVKPKEIVLAVNKALKTDAFRKELHKLQEEVIEKYSVRHMVGQSPVMKNVYHSIHKASKSLANVLITGETGTGKELAARAIHYNGLARKGPFVAVNSSVFPEGTLESELFGHEKGAFTHALKERKGRFELADRGTLFMDEIGEISSHIQVKLLRVIQDKKFERVGGQETIQSNFRLITATNQDLRELVSAGKFREDLFYRLSIINISMPPLRDHPEDIPLLIKHFLKKFTIDSNKDIRTLSIDALKLMQSFPWPGNVRQLENAIESAVAMCDGNMIRIQDLPLELQDLPVEIEPGLPPGSLPQVVESVEKRLILKAMEQCGGIKAQAAKSLGISERMLSYKIEKYAIGKSKPTQ
ncbi:MAG: sigma-54 dependent transcriptional regulator [Desulfobacteraceae bacterium]|nr:sigma-54 dependent transcriptional regulator [Desulfobacteraceae bacterium]